MALHTRPAAGENRPLFLTDGGLETTLIFHDGWDLPEFAAFPLLVSSSGRAALLEYYQRYLTIAESHGLGFILETPTWRASVDWGRKLGFAPVEIDDINLSAVHFLRELAARSSARLKSMLLVSGQVGPYDDGYQPASELTVAAAQSYHTRQVEQFAEAGVDQIDAITLSYVEEAIGITQAATQFDTPVVISFTVETDGHLPNGMPLGDAIRAVDAATQCAPAHYMINCAHPDHFRTMLTPHASWLERIGGLRSNASRLSHAELDNATVLDEGDPVEFGLLHERAFDQLPNLWVLGGCCGTDHRHVEEIARRCGPLASSGS